MLYVIIFVIAFVLGYGLAIQGMWGNLKTGRMFYRRDNGDWIPYNPIIAATKEDQETRADVS